MGENVRVICRVRPLNANEINIQSKNVITFPSSNTLSISGKNFTFDSVIPPNCSQEELYIAAGKPVVNNVLSGYNGTVFAYGQTASGKTFTMIGKSNDNLMKGLIPRIVHDIFQHISGMNESLSFLLKVSYLEIYMEKIRDLLDITKDNLPIFEDANRSTYVKGGTERYVGTPEEVFDILEEGRTNRSVAQTAMNMDSSRSHSIFSFFISQEDQGSKKMLHGRLYLVDLAGSEKVSKTAAEGQTLEEAKIINKSLSCLGNVINALVEGSSHIPYRDSKLTRILQESLGGNAKTTMIICISPAAYNEAESKSTCLFGTRAKTIKNVVQVNMELTTEEWKKQYNELKSKYMQLLEQYQELENETKKWRKGEQVPKSQWLAEFHGGLKEDPVIQEMTIQTTKEHAKGSDNVAVDKLYKEIDAKDEEVAKLSESVSKHIKEFDVLKVKIASLVKERDQLSKINVKLQSDFETKSKEVKDLLHSLEDMATTIEERNKQIQLNQIDTNNTLDFQLQFQTEIKGLNSKIVGLQQGELEMREVIIESLKGLKENLVEIGMTMNPSIGTLKEVTPKKLEEEFNNIKIYISKIKGETHNFCAKAKNGLVGKEAEPYKKIEILEKKIDIIRKNADERIATLITEKRKVELDLNIIKKEITLMKTDSKKEPKSSEKNPVNVKAMMEFYTDDITEVRQALNEKSKENQELKNKLDVITVELEIMKKADFGLDTNAQMEKREQAKNELKGLEENVNREIGSLHNLRKVFISDLKSRIKKVSVRQNIREMLNDDEDEFLGIERLTPQQRERITFLENNLENLTKVHKNLVRDNANLRCEAPKLEKRLKASGDRIKQLEISLKESKELTVKERRKYQSEMDRIKESTQRLTSVHPTIAKPVQAGGQK